MVSAGSQEKAGRVTSIQREKIGPLKLEAQKASGEKLPLEHWGKICSSVDESSAMSRSRSLAAKKLRNKNVKQGRKIQRERSDQDPSSGPLLVGENP